MTTDYSMTINNQSIQQNHYLGQHSYPNQMVHQANYHQSLVQSNNHSHAFNHLGTNEYKTNQEHQHQMHHRHHLEKHQSINSLDNELNNNEMEIYRPELTPVENPFYYNKNKLLFDLHIERQRRHQPHP